MKSSVLQAIRERSATVGGLDDLAERVEDHLDAMRERGCIPAEYDMVHGNDESLTFYWRRKSSLSSVLTASGVVGIRDGEDRWVDVSLEDMTDTLVAMIDRVK